MWKTLIRDGNHFIRLDKPHYKSGQWFLVDGPWFRYLSNWVEKDIRLNPGSCIWTRVELSITVAIYQVIYEKPYTDAWWERMGHFSGLASKDNRLTFVPPYLYRYTRVTTYQCNDGILPFDLRCPNYRKIAF